MSMTLRCTRCNYQGVPQNFVTGVVYGDAPRCRFCKAVAVPMKVAKRQAVGADAPQPQPGPQPQGNLAPVMPQQGPLTATQETSAPLINAALWGTVPLPSEAQLEKDSLNPYVVQVDTSVTTCASTIPASLVSGWQAWYQGWVSFYNTKPTFLSAGGDIERVSKMRAELKGWQDTISPYCAEAATTSWTASQIGAVMAVTGASGFFMYRAVKAQQYVLPTAALGVGLVGATFFLVSPKRLESSVDVPQQNVTAPSVIDQLAQTTQTWSNWVKVGIVVGGALVGWMVYNNIKSGTKVVTSLTPKLLGE